MLWIWLGAAAALIWTSLLILPWRPWAVREVLEAPAHPDLAQDLSDVTVLIPARNEAETLGAVLAALREQGPGLRVIVVDDQSTDGTGDIARAGGFEALEVISGEPLPAGWTGKVWAMEQGRRRVCTPWLLLIDADITLAPGLIPTLRERMREDGLQLLSLMAWLRMDSLWERLLLPAFVYFFKLIYPFRLANADRPRGPAAAAGGCVMLERRALEVIGGFASIQDAIIDDCALASRIKRGGYRTWIGLTHSVCSLRTYDRLSAIWDMVARTAYTQLRYSLPLLLVLSALFLLAYAAPLVALLLGGITARATAAFALGAMMISYLPTLRFYGLSPGWALLLPLIAALYLAMTWSSAWRYRGGQRSAWKGRRYGRTG
jgi:hopene-associated glycosyltransferase HpnB